MGRKYFTKLCPPLWSRTLSFPTSTIQKKRIQATIRWRQPIIQYSKEAVKDGIENRSPEISSQLRGMQEPTQRFKPAEKSTMY